MSHISVFESKPTNFSEKIEVSACYLEVQGHLLLLQRAFNKTDPGKWGVPGGKLEKGETPLEAMARELFEETAIHVHPIEQFSHLGTLYVRRPEMDYIYHLFDLKLHEFPKVYLSEENLDYQWIEKENLCNVPLMSGGKEGLDYYFIYKNKHLHF